ncbi:MAG: LytR C-terminal domain-containing protein [Patescibacteria group bacterium]
MNKQTAQAILYLERNRLQYYPSGAETPLELLFDQVMVSDLEVKKTDLLNDHIRIFIDQNKINPGSFITLLSEDICLVKVFSEGTGETRKDEIRKFLDLAPFENLRSKTYPFEKGFKLYAVNRDYYEIVEAAFEKFGFRAEATVPLSMLGTDISDKNIFKNLNLAKQYSLSGQQNLSGMNEKQKEFVGKNKRFIVMLGVFCVLILVLLSMIIFVLKPFEAKSKAIKTIVAPQQITVVIPTPPVVTEGTINPREVKVEILNGSPVVGQAGQMREIFLSLGFKEITVGNISGIVPKSGLAYTASVSAQLVDKVVSRLRVNFPDLTVSQTVGGDFGIIFTIGRDLKLKIAP